MAYMRLGDLLIAAGAITQEQLEEALLARYHERVLEKAPSRVFAPRIRKGSCKVAVLATNPA